MPDFGSPNQVYSAHRATRITAAAPTTTVVKSGPGVLAAIVINTPAATGTITIYDNTAASGTVIALITMVAGQAVSLQYNVGFTTGLTIVTATAAGDITVVYS